MKASDMQAFRQFAELPKVLLLEGKQERKEASFTRSVAMPVAQYEKLNATWSPRGYLLDGHGRLVSLQTPSEDAATFLRRVRVWQRGE
jgi:hypothetical protein